jgi:TrmH family RNA methyltransferase
MFVAEGIKSVREFLASDYKEHVICSTDPGLLEECGVDVCKITLSELRKMSGFKTPNKVIGVFHIPDPEKTDFSDWAVALDSVKDPGNLGTIIRLCDWFGIGQLLCSPDCVDCYNPKVLQATMGSITRVNITYAPLKTVLQEGGSPVYGAFMDGEVVYKVDFPETGILVLGNEANGISGEIASLLSGRISIPPFGPRTAESLNVAAATAILLNEIRRV